MKTQTNKEIEIISDKVSVNGPRIDGTYKVTFEVGEYMRDKIGDIIKLPTDNALKVTIELYE